MKKTIATLTAVALALPLVACAGTPQVDPNYLAYVQGEVAKAQEQYKAETARLLALTAIGQAGDDRVKDRAVAELTASRQSLGAPSIAPPAPKPNEALQWAQVLLSPLTILGQSAIHEAGAVKRDEQATIRHGITFGTLGGIAQGGYNLGAQGIQGVTTLGQAGIAKIPSMSVMVNPLVLGPDPLPPAPEASAR